MGYSSLRCHLPLATEAVQANLPVSLRTPLGQLSEANLQLRALRVMAQVDLFINATSTALLDASLARAGLTHDALRGKLTAFGVESVEDIFELEENDGVALGLNAGDVNRLKQSAKEVLSGKPTPAAVEGGGGHSGQMAVAAEFTTTTTSRPSLSLAPSAAKVVPLPPEDIYTNVQAYVGGERYDGHPAPEDAYEWMCSDQNIPPKKPPLELGALAPALQGPKVESFRSFLWSMKMDLGSALASTFTAVAIIAPYAVGALNNEGAHGGVIACWVCFIITCIFFLGFAVIRAVEVNAKRIFYYRSFQHGIIVDFKNDMLEDYLGGLQNSGTFALVLNLILACVLVMYGVAESKSIAFYFLFGVAMVAVTNAFWQVHAPYRQVDTLESNLISLSKFLERDPAKARDFLANCKVQAEEVTFQRISDIINRQRYEKYLLNKKRADAVIKKYGFSEDFVRKDQYDFVDFWIPPAVNRLELRKSATYFGPAPNLLYWFLIMFYMPPSPIYLFWPLIIKLQSYKKGTPSASDLAKFRELPLFDWSTWKFRSQRIIDELYGTREEEKAERAMIKEKFGFQFNQLLVTSDEEAGSNGGTQPPDRRKSTRLENIKDKLGRPIVRLYDFDKIRYNSKKGYNGDLNDPVKKGLVTRDDADVRESMFRSVFFGGRYVSMLSALQFQDDAIENAFNFLGEKTALFAVLWSYAMTGYFVYAMIEAENNADNTSNN